MSKILSCSIVLYNNNIEIVEKTIDSILKTPIEKDVFVIDNSNNASFKNKLIKKRIVFHGFNYQLNAESISK